MSISSKIEELALDKSAIKAAIEAKLPDIPPTDSLSQWPTSIMSIPRPEPEIEPEPSNYYVRPSDWPDLPSILAAHPASEKGYGYAYAMLVEGRSPKSSNNYMTVPARGAGCRHYVTSWGLDEDAKSSSQKWILSDPSLYNKYEWIIVYTDNAETITLWGPCYYPYNWRWLVWFYAPDGIVTNNGSGFCGIMSMTEFTAKQVNGHSNFFTYGKGDHFCKIDIEKYRITDNTTRINGSVFPSKLGHAINFDIEFADTAKDVHEMFFGQRWVNKIKPFSIVPSITNLNRIFHSCISIENIDLSGWNTSGATNMSSMFNSAFVLKNLDLSNFDVSNATTMESMFESCISLEKIDFSGWNPTSLVNMRRMFYYCTKIKNIDCSVFDVCHLTNLEQTFYGSHLIKSLNIENWNTENVTTMNQMFCTCYSLETVDVSKWDVGKVTNVVNMFNECHMLRSLDVSKWNIGENGTFTSMTSMFYNCISLQGEIDMSNWNTSNVTSFESVFMRCSMLETINVTGIDAGKVTTTKNMMTACYNLKNFNSTGWNTSKLSIATSMFNSCYFLEQIDLSGWNTESLTQTDSMFANCLSLRSIDISSWNLSKITNMGSMFNGCVSLEFVKMPDTKTVYGSQFATCTSCLLYDFRLCTSVPVLRNTNAFTSINANAKIVVPDALYDSWIAASNWSNSTIKSKIISVSDYESL